MPIVRLGLVVLQPIASYQTSQSHLNSYHCCQSRLPIKWQSQHFTKVQIPTLALCIVPHDLDRLAQKKWICGLVVEYSYVKFGDPTCIGFWDITRIDRQTHKRCEKQSPATAACIIGNKFQISFRTFHCFQLKISGLWTVIKRWYGYKLLLLLTHIM